MADRFRGVFTIPCTPFTESGELDDESLRREVRFCIDAGAHGIVAPVNASEFTSLTDEERRQVASTLVEETAGRVPVVIGVTGASEEIAVSHARHARAIGADAVIAMPPHVRKASAAEIERYYRAISAAAGLPVFLQDFMPPVGTPMSAELMARLLQGIEHVDYVKEETIPAGHVMTRLITLAGDALKGVMGGMAGRYLLDEYRRGACGTMPACEITDLHVALWNRLEAGDEAGARALFNRMLPLLNYEALFGATLYKEVLYRRGILRSPRTRGAVGPLDAFDHRELDAILADLSPLFVV
jgi:dihydrodipicolinate synthase/N-acetylneuraminate lyase